MNTSNSKSMVSALLIFAFVCGLVKSAPVIASFEVNNISHGSATIRVFLTQAMGSNDKADFGMTTLLTSSTYTMSSGGTKMKSIGIGGLAPSTKYYFNPVISANGETSSPLICAAAGSGPGYTCEGAGVPPAFVTTSKPSDSPIPPNPTSLEPFDKPMPIIDGSRFYVGVENNRCVNATETFAAAAQADQMLNHEVIIPAGAVCEGPFTLPPRSGPGYIVVRTSTSYDLLPPEGVRTNSAYLPFMATLILNPKYAKNVGNNGLIRAWNTHYWRFVGIEFTVMDPAEVTPVYLGITEINLSGELVALVLNETITDNELMTTHSLVSVAGVQGLEGINSHFRIYARSPAPANSILLNLLSSSVSGTWVSGTGLVYAAHRPIEIESVSNDVTPVITTKTPHMLAVSPKISITSIDNGVITISKSHNYGPSFGVVAVSDCSVSAFNGLWGISALPSGSSMKMRSEFPSGQCSSNCGFIEVKNGAQVSGVPGILSGVLYEVLTPTSFKILTTEGPLSWQSGGWVVQDIDIIWDFVGMFESSSKFVLDRCILNGRGFPYRYLYAIQMAANDSVVMNSVIQEFSSWKGVKPITKTFEFSGSANYVAVAVSLTTGVNKLIYNNLIKDIPGITIFAEEFGAVMPFNVICERNTIHTDLQYMAGSATSNGRYYLVRHQLESKVGRQWSIRGNIFDGNWADGIPLGPTILLSPRAGSDTNFLRGITDVDISDNTIINTGEGVMVFGHETLSSASVENTARIRISNNIIDADYYTFRSLPSKDGPTKVANFGGQSIYLDFALEDVSVTHNTLFCKGRAPVGVFIANCRVSGFLIENNIGEMNNDESYGGFISSAAFYGIRDVKPAIDATNSRTAFEDCAFNSRLWSNVVIPGVTNSSAWSNFETTTYSISKQTCDAQMSVFESVHCVGTDNASETPINRLDLVGFVDWRNKNYELLDTSEFAAGNAKDASDGKSMGVDYSRLSSAQGRVLNVNINVDSSSVSIQYRAPDSEKCYVDISTVESFTQLTRTADAGGERDRQVDLTLDPNTTYFYRIQCAAEQPTGSFFTAENTGSPTTTTSPTGEVVSSAACISIWSGLLYLALALV